MSGPSVQTLSGQSGAANYGFIDPYGVTSNLQNTLYGTGGAVSGGPMGTYNANATPVMGQIAGLSGPLQQTLSGIARYQAQNALNATGSNFANQGALGSGAAAQAFGQALANPFAQAQSQLQQGQLQTAGSALQQLMGVSGSTYGQGLQAGSNLMEHASGLVAPTYYTNPGTAGKLTGAGIGLGGNVAGQLAGPTLGATGSSIASALGKGAPAAPALGSGLLSLGSIAAAT